MLGFFSLLLECGIGERPTSSWRRHSRQYLVFKALSGSFIWKHHRAFRMVLCFQLKKLLSLAILMFKLNPFHVQDIWCHVHSLLPLRDAARAACVSHMFLSAWRCYPNLIFTKKTLSLKQSACGEDDIAWAFTCIVDQILKKHSGNGLKTLKLNIFHCHNLDAHYLNNWLQIAITPGVEKLILKLPLQYEEGYSFPCSLLFGGNGNSIQHLHLTSCAFRPTFGIGCFRSLTKFYLFGVRITGEELGCLLSNAFALEQFELRDCSEIICLKIPCVLQRLSRVTVSTWEMLQMIESKAPNLSTFKFVFSGDLVQLSLGSSQVKNLSMDCIDDCNLLCYAITKLPYITPNVETLRLSSLSEVRSEALYYYVPL